MDQNLNKSSSQLLSHDLKELDHLLHNLPEVVRTKTKLTNIFASILKNMSENVNYNDIFDSIFNALEGIIPFERIGITLLENRETSIRLDWIKSKISEEWLIKDYSESFEHSILAEVIETDSPLIINDFNKYLDLHPDLKAIELLIKDGMRSGLSCPLKIEGSPCGAITFSHSSPGTYSHLHIDLFSEISSGLSVIMEKEMFKKWKTKANLQEDAFKSTVHDLSNPLTIILAALRAIEKNPSYEFLNDDLKKMFRMLRRNCESMIATIKSVVYENNEIITRTGHHDNFPLKDFLLDISNECETLAKSKDITTNVVIEPSVPLEANFNNYIIKEAINNLISNAIKFSPRGKTITLKAYFQTKGSKLFIAVIDEGPGIPIEEQEKLFKKHGKTSVLPTEGEPSSGRGLANVKQLIEGIGGEVFVKSEVGRGSTFGFSIPIKLN